MNHRAMTFAATVVAAILTLQTVAGAHAFLDHSEPRVGATASKTPTAVKIWFTQHVEPVFSAIQVFGPDGKEIDKKDTHADPHDAGELIVSLSDGPPGVYRVAWHVVSVDTHRTQGDFKFTVKP